jgi:hypothetical protein
MVSPTFLRVTELSGWVVALGNSNRVDRIGLSWFADNAALRSRRNLTAPARRSDVSDRPTSDAMLSSGDKNRRGAPPQHDRTAQHKFSSTLLRYRCDAELCWRGHFLYGGFDQSY